MVSARAIDGLWPSGGAQWCALACRSDMVSRGSVTLLDRTGRTELLALAVGERPVVLARRVALHRHPCALLCVEHVFLDDHLAGGRRDFSPAMAPRDAFRR